MHKHEWWFTDDGWIGAKCGCGEVMTGTEARRRINATECLSAEDAKFAYRNLIPTDSHAPNVDYSLRAYTRALEGKDA